MKNHVIFTFDNGLSYAVSTSVVAAARNTALAADFPGESPEVIAAQTEELFADPMEITEYAVGNMDWKELAPHARLVGFDAGDSLHDRFVRVSTHCVDELPELPELQPERLLHTPLELILSRMSRDDAQANILRIVNQAGDRALALATIRGHSEVVDLYIGVINELGSRLNEAAQEEAAAHAATTNSSNQAAAAN